MEKPVTSSHTREVGSEGDRRGEQKSDAETRKTTNGKHIKTYSMKLYLEQ